jgi:hypothetical protein
MSKATEDSIERLLELLRYWPTPNGDDPSRSQVTLEPYLADDFDEADLLNKISAIGDLSSVSETDDRVSIEFSDIDGDLHRAVFRRSSSGDWSLSSLKFQCPICFGTGVNMENTCTGCGGSGWGAL